MTTRPGGLGRRLAALTLLLGPALGFVAGGGQAAAGTPTASAAPAPASAAPCSGPDDVTVVVDFKGLGGGVTAGCAASSNAWQMFQRAGYGLTSVQRQPGFVCRVSGKPTDQSCVDTPPATAYWGLFWSKGNGRWTYSSLGAGSLRVPEGGYVAFAWQSGGGRSLPSFAPVDRSAPDPEPDPDPDPDPQPDPDPTTPTQDPTTTSPTPTETPSPSQTPTEKPDKKKTKKPKKDKKTEPTSPTSSEATAAPVGDPPADASDDAAGDVGGVPGWVIAGLAIALAVGGGAVVAVRRRRLG